MHPTTTSAPATAPVEDFIARWAQSGAAERANKDSFLNELCEVLGVPRPDPTTGEPEKDRYCFEKDALTTHEGGKVSTGKIDLYKEGCFILEAKQGSEAGAAKLGTAKRGTAMWALAMQAAYGQALGYAQTFDNPPPFLVVCDIGYCFDLYASFDGSRNYRDFPTAQHKRIYLRDLPAHVETLRALFIAPQSLDPAKRTTKVTRAIAEHLAELARDLEAQKYPPQDIATFLMRCIFTMFAEDAGLLPERAFTTLLEKEWIPNPDRFADEVAQLWEKMNTGGALIGVGKILHFNGGLFATQKALPLTRTQLQLLHEASRSSWVDVEPAIFGTLLERALDPKERHALGAHFTPRAYVERLVRPTIEEPLRAEWDIVRAHVQQLLTEAANNDKAAPKKAVGALQAFHRRLCGVSVLDPACGTGNFLYVTLDLLKRLESEVFQLLADLGETQTPLQVAGLTVTPAQFHGIEVKPWAKEIAELVLWIGYLQWLMRTRGDAGHIPEPVLQQYGNIEGRDAVLAWERVEPVVDNHGEPLTRWDGESTKPSPVTGEPIPDESQRVPVVRYINPRRATWPAAEFIIGNPPYIGTKRMRQALGEGYVEAIRGAYAADVEDNADFVMFWWHTAAALVRARTARRFGFITTNSITQAFNRRVVTQHVDAETDPLAILFAIPDHPWVDSANGAAVRVAMTVGALEDKRHGRLLTVTTETENADADGAALVTFEERRGPINADLTIGANLVRVEALRANDGLCTNGVALHGQGFVLTPEVAVGLRASGPSVIKRYLGGKDLLAVPRELYVIDFSFLSEEQARAANPAAFQHVIDYVKPERDHNKRDSIRDKWWRFAWERPVLMKALKGLTRYIATTETAKHRVFQFLPVEVVPDHMILAFALDDAYALGVLSSRVHVAWTLGAGGTLEDRPRYNKSVCFDPFPFPDASDAQKARVRELAERLDAHRKTQQKAHPDLTMTGMYNVLERLRGGVALNAKDKVIHEHGLVSLLRQIHEELDAAVLDAYGWPHGIANEELLQKLVALNADRVAEEEAGVVRWLRPAFQNPSGTEIAVQTGLVETTPTGAAAQLGKGPAGAQPWPKLLPERIGAVRAFVNGRGDAVAVADVRRAFKGAPSKDVEAALDTLASLGLLLRYESEQGKRWKAAGP